MHKYLQPVYIIFCLKILLFDTLHNEETLLRSKLLVFYIELTVNMLYISSVPKYP